MDINGNHPKDDTTRTNPASSISRSTGTSLPVNQDRATLSPEIVETRKIVDLSRIVREVHQDPTKANKADSTGWRPLDYAAFYGSREAIAALLKAGSDPTWPGDNGLLPIERTKNPEIKALLEQSMSAKEEDPGS